MFANNAKKCVLAANSAVRSLAKVLVLALISAASIWWMHSVVSTENQPKFEPHMRQPVRTVKQIVVQPLHGFGNQLRSVVSAVVLSKWLNSSISVGPSKFQSGWQTYFDAPIFRHALSYESDDDIGCGVEDGNGRDEVSIMSVSPTTKKNCIEEGTNCDYFDEGCINLPSNMKLRLDTLGFCTIYAVRPCGMSNQKYDSTKLDFYSSIRPRQEIQKKLQLITQQFAGHRVVGIQYRHTDNCRDPGKLWKAGLVNFIRHQTLERSGCPSLSTFQDMMVQELRKDNTTIFYFASDDADAYDTICKSNYGDLRPCKDGLVLGHSNQDYVVDILALSCTERIIGSQRSTYSAEAANLGGIPLYDWDEQIYRKPFASVNDAQVARAFRARITELCRGPSGPSAHPLSHRLHRDPLK